MKLHTSCNYCNNFDPTWRYQFRCIYDLLWIVIYFSDIIIVSCLDLCRESRFVRVEDDWHKLQTVAVTVPQVRGHGTGINTRALPSRSQSLKTRSRTSATSNWWYTSQVWGGKNLRVMDTKNTNINLFLGCNKILRLRVSQCPILRRDAKVARVRERTKNRQSPAWKRSRILQ